MIMYSLYILYDTNKSKGGYIQPFFEAICISLRQTQYLRNLLYQSAELA